MSEKLHFSPTLLAYVGDISYLCIQIRGGSSHTLNFKLSNTMIFFIHFIHDKKLQECGITAEQLKKLLDYRYPDGRIVVEKTTYGAWVKTYQEADDAHDVTKNFVDSLE